MPPHPYAERARDALRAGWAPLPVPLGKKAPVPDGYTGHEGAWPSGADVEEWCTGSPANLALRLPANVVGVDVDAYGGRAGAATLEAAVAELGPLPATWRSSARWDDPLSGIRFYRAPAGRRWAGGLGAGVDVISYGYRYAVVAPSRHPDGGTYAWVPPAGGELTSEPPKVDELPALPVAWMLRLTVAGTVDAKADLEAGEAGRLLASFPDGEPCRAVLEVLEAIPEQLEHGRRHDTAARFTLELVRLGEQGHTGAREGLARARELWVEALGRGDPRKPGDGEFERLVTGAAAIMVAAPTPPDEIGCCGEPLEVSPLVLVDLDVEGLPPAVERELAKMRVRELARAVLARERIGELPAVVGLEAFLAVADDPVTYRVDEVWPTGGRVVLAAQHKAGKTTLVGNLMRSLVDGEPFLDVFGVARCARVVLVDNELDERMLRRWLRDQGVENVGAVEVVALRGRASLFDLLDRTTRGRWARLLAGADVLLVDCLRPALDALGLDENREAGRFLECFDELLGEAGISEGLVVHHMGHAGARSRGDSRIVDWPDALWSLNKSDDADELTTPSSPRSFAAYGRDVDVPERLLEYDREHRRLRYGGDTRRELDLAALLEAVVAHVEAFPTSSKAAVERALAGKTDRKRQAIERAVNLGKVRVWIDGQTHRLLPLSMPIPPPPEPPKPRERKLKRVK